MPKRCGDAAEFHYSVKEKSVGSPAVTRVIRQKDGNLTASALETLQKKERKTIKWPDLQDAKGHGWIGGRKADFKGLDKASYQAKFDQQCFDLELVVAGGKARSSTGLKIAGYPDVARDHKKIGIPMPVEVWDQVVGPTGVKAWSKIWSDPTGTAYVASGAGNFHLEVKDGVVQVTVKLDLWSNSWLFNKSLVFGYVKEHAEEFWNGPRGFRQWTWHRTGCKRGPRCDCRLVTDRKGKYLQAGCCKVPVRLDLQQGADNKVEITVLTIGQLVERAQKGYVSTARDHSANFFWPESSPRTYAHEVGHLMGFPDQYLGGGVTATGAIVQAGAHKGKPIPTAPWPIDPGSIMGQNMAQAKEIHFAPRWFRDWVVAHVEDVKALKT